MLAFAFVIIPFNVFQYLPSLGTNGTTDFQNRCFFLKESKFTWRVNFPLLSIDLLIRLNVVLNNEQNVDVDGWDFTI